MLSKNRCFVWLLWWTSMWWISWSESLNDHGNKTTIENRSKDHKNLSLMHFGISIYIFISKFNTHHFRCLWSWILQIRRYGSVYPVSGEFRECWRCWLLYNLYKWKRGKQRKNWMWWVCLPKFYSAYWKLIKIDETKFSPPNDVSHFVRFLLSKTN